MHESARNAPPFRTAVRLLTRTTRFLLFNLAVYGGFLLAFFGWIGVFGGLAAFFGPRIELLGVIFLLLAVMGPGAILAFGRRYFLYLVKGAHIAVVTKLLLDDELPDDRGQVAYGREVLRTHFRDMNILFVLDRMVYRTVQRFTRRFVRLVDWLPLGIGAGKLARWVAAMIRRSLSYVDEAILSYAIARDEPNVWKSARHGLILFAQAYPPILMTAVKVWILGRVVFVALLVALGIPAVLLLLAYNAIWLQVALLVGVLVTASLLVRAVYEPFATTWVVLTYHYAIAGLEVDPEWDERLQSISGEFKKLSGKAREFAVGGSGVGGGGGGPGGFRG